MILLKTKRIQLIFLLLAPFYFSIAQQTSSTPFDQEIATVFTPADGLPAFAFTGLQIDKSGNILAVSDQGIYKYDGKRWKLSSKVEPVKKEAPFSEGVLARATYNEQKYIGKANGLFVQEEKNGSWKEVFPADGVYSWKLSEVAVLETDSKGRLWFGSNQGVGFLQNGKWKLFTGKEGLPFTYFTCGSASPDGAIWLGYKKRSHPSRW